MRAHKWNKGMLWVMGGLLGAYYGAMGGALGILGVLS